MYTKYPEIVVDFNNNLPYNLLKFVQNDTTSCGVIFTFLQPIEINDDVIVTFELPSGAKRYEVATIDSTTQATVDFTTDILSEVGVVKFQMAVYNIGGARLTTPLHFQMSVVEDLYDVDTVIEGTDAYENAVQLLEQLVAQYGNNFVLKTGDTMSGTLITPEIQLSGGLADQGKFTWNADENTVDLQTNGTTLQLGQEVIRHVSNKSGVDIPDGTAVMYVGSLGASGKTLIAKMDASGSIPSHAFIGITTEDIPNNDVGKVAWFGKVRGVNTSDWSEGDVLYLDATVLGGLTNVAPQPPALQMPVASVISSANNGTIMVRPIGGFRIDELDNVLITNPQDGDILKYNATGGYWYNAPSA